MPKKWHLLFPDLHSVLSRPTFRKDLYKCIQYYPASRVSESLSIFPEISDFAKKIERDCSQYNSIRTILPKLKYGVDFGRARKRLTLYDDRSLNRVFSIPIAVHAKDENLKALNETRVVIIGGGYGGIAAANKLKDQCKLTLIDARDAFHHNMGAQRSSVETGA